MLPDSPRTVLAQSNSRTKPVTAAKVKKGSLTGAQINASTLRLAPFRMRRTRILRIRRPKPAKQLMQPMRRDAHDCWLRRQARTDGGRDGTTAEEATIAESADNSGHLGGIGPTGFIQGSGNIVRGYESTSSPDGNTTLMTIPNLGDVRVDCSGGDNRIAFFPSVSGSSLVH